MLKAASGRKPLRVCVCVIFNHPFPKIIPIIREIYKDRFHKLLFFMPFERMPDEDVITVYHGCYASPAYITESRHILEQMDCDVFMFVHDDVILNPKLNEGNFADYFPLGPEDGFIPVAESPPEAMGDWIWYFGSVPKMFFPKSILFSGGIEYENVYKYLPDPKKLIAKLEGLGVHHKTFVRLDYENMPDVETKPSRALFHGITRSRADGVPVRIQDGTDLQEEAERLSLEAVRAFTKAMNATLRADDPDQMRGDYIDLPYPLISTGYLSDFYIIPKGKLTEFAHYAGVFTAANIWHETMVATIMFAICDKVYRAQDLGLNFAGFTDRPGLEAFHDPDYMAIHPVKLSPYATPDAASSFLTLLRAIGEGYDHTPKTAHLGLISFGRLASENFAGTGWWDAEDWGRWSSGTDVELNFDVPADLEFGTLRLHLHAPLHEKVPTFAGTVSANGHPPVPVSSSLGDPGPPSVDLPRAHFVRGRNSVRIDTPSVVVPSQINPDTDDSRPMGFALRAVEFLA